jgi:plasmid segregation protein ParM
VLSNEIVDTAARLIEPYARKLNGVIVAGGGAEFMFQELSRRWPHAVKPSSPRFSVAEGMRRYGLMLNLSNNVLGEAA